MRGAPGGPVGGGVNVPHLEEPVGSGEREDPSCRRGATAAQGL